MRSTDRSQGRGGQTFGSTARSGRDRAGAEWTSGVATSRTSDGSPSMRQQKSARDFGTGAKPSIYNRQATSTIDKYSLRAHPVSRSARGSGDSFTSFRNELRATRRHPAVGRVGDRVVSPRGDKSGTSARGTIRYGRGTSQYTGQYTSTRGTGSQASSGAFDTRRMHDGLYAMGKWGHSFSGRNEEGTQCTNRRKWKCG